MTILFAISIIAFCALLWACLSIARHIRVGNHIASPSIETISRDRYFHRQQLGDLNDQPFARRVPQQRTRTSTKHDDIAS